MEVNSNPKASMEKQRITDLIEEVIEGTTPFARAVREFRYASNSREITLMQYAPTPVELIRMEIRAVKAIIKALQS